MSPQQRASEPHRPFSMFQFCFQCTFHRKVFSIAPRVCVRGVVWMKSYAVYGYNRHSHGHSRHSGRTRGEVLVPRAARPACSLQTAQRVWGTPVTPHPQPHRGHTRLSQTIKYNGLCQTVCAYSPVQPHTLRRLTATDWASPPSEERQSPYMAESCSISSMYITLSLSSRISAAGASMPPSGCPARRRLAAAWAGSP